MSIGKRLGPANAKFGISHGLRSPLACFGLVDYGKRTRRWHADQREEPVIRSRITHQLVIAAFIYFIDIANSRIRRWQRNGYFRITVKRNLGTSLVNDFVREVLQGHFARMHGFEIGQRILIRFAIRTLFNNKLRTRLQLLSNVFFRSGNRCFQPGTNIRKRLRNSLRSIGRSNVFTHRAGEVNGQSHLHVHVVAQNGRELLIAGKGIITAIVEQLDIQRADSTIHLRLRFLVRAKQVVFLDSRCTYYLSFTRNATKLLQREDICRLIVKVDMNSFRSIFGNGQRCAAGNGHGRRHSRALHIYLHARKNLIGI